MDVSLKERLKEGVLGVLSAVIVGLFFLNSCLGPTGMPDHALLFVDGDNNVYSPSLVMDDSREFHILCPLEIALSGDYEYEGGELSQQDLADIDEERDVVWLNNQTKKWHMSDYSNLTRLAPAITAGDRRRESEKYRLDKKHKDMGGFVGQDVGLVRYWLGLYRNRWNDDGTWNW